MPDDSTHYLYGLYMRPPGLGCQPRDGLLWTQEDEADIDGRHIWGLAMYDRPLSEKETAHYDMMFLGRFVPTGQKEVLISMRETGGNPCQTTSSTSTRP